MLMMSTSVPHGRGELYQRHSLLDSPGNMQTLQDRFPSPGPSVSPAFRAEQKHPLESLLHIGGVVHGVEPGLDPEG